MPSSSAQATLAHIANGVVPDIRDAVRSLRKTPMQTATIIVCLAVGSTLTTGAFSIINGVVAGELPGVRDRDQLVTLHVAHRSDEQRHSAPMLLSEFLSLPAAQTPMTHLAAESGGNFSLNAAGTALNTPGAYVSGTYFSTLGAQAEIGRLLTPDDDRPDAPPVVVIGYALWRSRFVGDASVLGSTLRLGKDRFEVVGVAPRDFVGLQIGRIGETNSRPSLWMPLAKRASVWDPTVTVVARLASNTTIDHAESAAQLMIPLANARLGAARLAEIRLEPLHLTQLTGAKEISRFVASFMAIPLIVLIIACANVAGVQLARSSARAHELSVRVSLGATRVRVMRLLVIETLVLASVAGAVGWFASAQILRIAANLLPFVPLPDARVLLFAVSLPVLVTVAAGIYPAWRATGLDVIAGLRLGARAGRVASPSLRRRVLIVQTALSVFLLLTSTVMARGLERLPSLIGPSFDDVIVSDVRLGGLGLPAGTMAGIRRSVVEQLSAAPGVTAVGQSEWHVFFGSQAYCWPDATTAISPRNNDGGKLVTPQYFDALRIKPLRGRLFNADAVDDVVVVNQAFLAAHASSSLDLGSVIRIRRGDQPSSVARIVGVVADSYERYPKGIPEPMCLLPLRDHAEAEWFTLYTQSSRPTEVAPGLQRILSGIDPRLAVGRSGTINDWLWAEYAGLDLVTRTVTWVSILALGLAMVGLFGSISHGTTQRLHEFGVRLALGASRFGLAAWIIREALAVAFLGTVAGALLATPPAMFFHRRLLTTITIADPVLIGVVTASVLLIAAAAAILPARRASAVNPVNALRGE